MSTKKVTFNGCARSQISVYPDNWNMSPPPSTAPEKAHKAYEKAIKEAISVPWRITYRFYDPVFKGTKDWAKLIPVKGMNDYKTFEERQKVTAGLVTAIEQMLDKEGYNPITEQFMAPVINEEVKEIDPKMHFIRVWTDPKTGDWCYSGALWEGYKKVVAVPETLVDIRCVIRGVAKAADQLFDNQLHIQYCDVPISKISTKHIKYILEQCGKNNPKWSNRRFNIYKAYLSMIFKELKEVEAVEANPTADISCRKKTRKMRAVLTPEEQEKINQLKGTHYTFWRYIQIFYGSQARSTEILEIKKDDRVNLLNQEFIVTVRKGKEIRDDVRPIPDDILPIFIELWNEAKPGQYLFSKGLVPGDKKIGTINITKRWRNTVKAPIEKGGLGINKDFYPLKHLRTDTVAAALDLEHAKAGTGHTNDATALLYAQGEKGRRLNKVKKVKVAFGKAI